MKVVVISGHPNLEQSVANKTILEEIKNLIPEVSVRKLNELYPDEKINVEAEQKALEDADVIVWQYPVFWYSLPALLKKYVDEVFAFGFAYGPEGSKLQGKKFIVSFTTGGVADAYVKGEKSYEIEAFLPVHIQTANFSNMEYSGAVHTTGLLYIPGVSPEGTIEKIQSEAKNHAERLADLIKNLK